MKFLFRLMVLLLAGLVGYRLYQNRKRSLEVKEAAKMAISLMEQGKDAEAKFFLRHLS